MFSWPDFNGPYIIYGNSICLDGSLYNTVFEFCMYIIMIWTLYYMITEIWTLYMYMYIWYEHCKIWTLYIMYLYICQWYEHSIKWLQREGRSVQVVLVAPSVSRLDPCIAVIFLLAMFCITVGGYWAGVTSASGWVCQGGGKLRGGEWGWEGENGLLIKLIHFILFMPFFSGLIQPKNLKNGNLLKKIWYFDSQFK